MNTIRRVLLLIAYVSFSCVLNSQTIKNIFPTIVDDKMVISYEISKSKFNHSFLTELYVSEDGGNTFQGPMTIVSDSNQLLKSGEYTIIWDVFKDLNNLDSDLNFDIRLKLSKEESPKKLFVQYSSGMLLSSTDYITPFGLRLGMIGNTGWYVSGYINTFEKYNYNYNDGQVQEAVLYEIGNQTLFPRASILGGLTKQIGWNTYMFAGVGYGYKKYFTNINILSINGEIQERCYLNHLGNDNSGIELETGIIYNITWVNLSLGISMFNFSELGATLGLGVSF